MSASEFPNINYNIGGSFYSHQKDFQSQLVHAFELMYSPKDFLCLGLILSNDHSFNIEFKGRRSFFGYGPSLTLNFPKKNGSRINLNCKYIYFTHIEQKTFRNNKLIHSKDFTIQKFILGYGINMDLNHSFGVNFGYNLFLYKTGAEFLDQFSELKGFYAGLNYNIKTKCKDTIIKNGKNLNLTHFAKIIISGNASYLSLIRFFIRKKLYSEFRSMRLINVSGGKCIMKVLTDNRPLKKIAYVYFILLIVLAGSNGCNTTDSNQQSVILKPVAGDTYIAGDTLVVSWLEPIAVPYVSYRYNHSEAWDSLAVIDYSDKSVKVILPDAWYSDSFQIQVEDRSGKINTVISGYFSVVFIKLFPLDRGTFFVGDTVALKWRHNPSKFSGIRIRLSTNGGKTFNELLSKSVNAVSTEYKWVAGQEISGYPFGYPSDKCVILVQDYDNAGYSDISRTFSIQKK